MAEAIAKKDLVRIRSGSPGIRHETGKIKLSDSQRFAVDM
jgi:hypothetical protein